MYRVRPLYCPFPSLIHPLTDTLERASVEFWAETLNLDATSSEYRRLERAEFGVFIGRCCPRVSEADLRLILDFTVWFFFWDDMCDEVMGADPDRIARLNAAADRVLIGGPAGSDANVLISVLHDIRWRLSQRMEPRALARFVVDLQDCLEAMVWQSSDRRHGIVQDVRTYKRCRRFSGGVYPVLSLIEMAEDVHLPIDVRSNPVVMNLMRSFNNLLCWANDIYSAAKELEQRDEHNLVAVLARHARLPIQAAVDRAAAIHDAEMARFEHLVRVLPEFGDNVDSDLRAMVRSLQSWLRGNIDWSTSTRRYGDLIEVDARTPFNLRTPARASMQEASLGRSR